MNAANALTRSSAASVAAVRPNPARVRKPSPLPLRPLVADRFRPPRGEKQVFLPNFTLAFLRTPTQPPHFASFLTPLWLNKLDLKDYLYNLYGVQALRVRSYVIHGKVKRNVSTGRLRRTSPQKKMTVELAQGVGEQGPFVWPEEEKEEDEKEDGKEKVAQKEAQKEAKKAMGRYREEQERRQRPDQSYQMEAEDAAGLRKRARVLLRGNVRWRPSWEEHGGEAVVAMGRGGRDGV